MSDQKEEEVLDKQDNQQEQISDNQAEFQQQETKEDSQNTDIANNNDNNNQETENKEKQEEETEKQDSQVVEDQREKNQDDQNKEEENKDHQEVQKNQQQEEHENSDKNDKQQEKNDKEQQQQNNNEEAVNEKTPEEDKTNEKNNEKKQRKKIFDETQQNLPSQKSPLTLDISTQQYQTTLDQSVNVEHIKQYHNEKQQQYLQQQNQTGTQILNYSSTDPDYQNTNSLQSKTHTTQSKGLNPEELDEHSLINQAALNRKIENFNQLKEWDHQRADFLNSHRNLIEAIIARVDQLSIMSTSHLEILIKYFSGKSRQEINYGRSPITAPNVLLDKHALSTNFTPYKEFSSLLSSLDKVSQDQMQKAQEFGTYIEKEILQEILLKDYDYQNQTMQQLREQILNYKKQLSENNLSAQKKSARFSLIYHSQLPRQQGSKQLMPRINKDLYKKELGFLRKAEQQREIQRQLARATLDFWVQGNQFEIARVKIIQQALDQYTKAYQKYVGDKKEILDEEFFKKLRQEFTEDSAQELFGIRKILHEQEINFVKGQLGKEESDQLSFQELQKYFEKFVIQEFSERMLVLKDWNASREMMPGNYQECKIVVTVDKFIHCFDLTNQIDKFGNKISDQKYRKPSYSIYLNSPKYEQLEEGAVKLRVSPYKQMVFMKFLTPKDINIFKFKSGDQAEEFIQIIDTL
ncbi:hypothetical protein PPERSA_02537 [Pseudocohnilembus persalinus]|uniref:Uncharacterized protein n=1 Tax=Pseudocohnilembus persalinus TaxID=266149 RepID=A0A0V0R593_PSEPJ|nr:hypothetical protein PPERSA_02537 [Pseudocohnilembus persalinus]|eukprot:KRX09665.1 hypothetical protein PPERSA_02537 [Pseudocohnilembus persalinus]